MCVCVVGGKPFACASQPPAVGDIWRRRYLAHRKKEEESRPEISSSKDITGFHYHTKGKNMALEIYSNQHG